jgi:hypothetical protein
VDWRRCVPLPVLVVVAVVLGVEPGQSQEYGSRLGSIQRGGEVSFQPTGPGVLMDALDPVKRKWYVPQELYNEYQWQQWETSNYARNQYQRYVNQVLEGDYFYDLYGNYITRGWLIFNNSQSQPQQFGSSVFKADRFGQWFNALIVSSDSKGQHHYAMTISDNIRSTLTPMTFSKPRWDGIQMDYSADKYMGTIIYSRLSSPGGSTTRNLEDLATNSTSLFGGRFTVQVGDFATVGVHGINTHQSNTLNDGFEANPVTGSLTISQNATVSRIEIVLRDDSPEDGVGGAAYFPAGSDIIITFVDGTRQTGKEMRFEPTTEGGFIGEGFLSADGDEEIKLIYDLDNPAFVNRAQGAKEEIEKVEFNLVLGNDYQVWMTSDQQLNSADVSTLLLVTQAEGNVQDNTNLRVVNFEYGLPTAVQIWGGTIEFQDLAGFDFYGEYDLSYAYTKYPNITKQEHSTWSGIAGNRSAQAWMMNLSRIDYPYFGLLEAYSMDPRYTTRTFTTLNSGFIDYENERFHVVELVDDNDDQDRFPDTVRKDWVQGDNEVYPGWDENNDFISDFNQNDNRSLSNSIPDYEEPFLRHLVDRPEYLFGIDMNHNVWVDRFENDVLPDYPYAKDHRGYNVYAGTHLTPEIKISAGVLREDLISSDQTNDATYMIFTLDIDTPDWGRFRTFEMLQSVQDDISNDLLQWLPNTNIRTGEASEIQDPLIARDTWVNSAWVGHDFNSGKLTTANHVKYDLYHQRLDRAERTPLGLRKRDYFLGVINKANYSFELGPVRLDPRWKSEYRKQTVGLTELRKRTELTEIFGIVGDMAILKHTTLQAGVEYVLFNDFEKSANDSRGTVWAAQFTNASAYLGYALTMQMGIQFRRDDPKGAKAQTLSKSFITVFAGLQ